MVGPKRVLVLYFSLTQQTAKVLEEIKSELEAANHSVDMRRIEPEEEWPLPVDKFTFYWNWFKIWIGFNLTQPLKPMELNGDDYDYIVLGFQPWNLAPSIPVNSFLDSPMSEIFRGKKVVGVCTCRGRWERSYRMAKDKIARAGGSLVDGLVIMNPEREPHNLVSTAYYLFHAKDPEPGRWMAKIFKPFGIGEEAVAVGREFGFELAQRLTQDRVTETRGWRMVNARLKLV